MAAIAARGRAAEVADGQRTSYTSVKTVAHRGGRSITEIITERQNSLRIETNLVRHCSQAWFHGHEKQRH